MASDLLPGAAGAPGAAPAPSAALLADAADRLVDLPVDTWEFGVSVGFEAMVEASRTTGQERWASYARGFLRGWATRAAPYRRLDCTAPGLAMVQVFETTGDPLVLEAAARLAAYLRTRPRLDGVYETWESSPLRVPYGPLRLGAEGVRLLAAPPPGVFVDCLHFDPPFLTALGAVTGDAELVDDGVAQALGYVRLLQTGSGLFDHFVLRGSPGRHGPGWGRGQGWALLGLIDVVERLEPGHPGREELVAAAVRLAAEVVRWQRADGHWSAVVTDPASGDETSTAAFMAGGLRRGARLGVLDPAEVLGPARRALEATLRETTTDGVLSGVSAAVWASTEPAHYAHVPRGSAVPWGQGPLVLAIAEHLRGAP